MLKKALRLKTIMVLFLLVALVCSDAFAWGGRNGWHYYRGGRWYRHGGLWFDTAIAALTVGALVESLPPRYTTVVYGGVPYYYYDSYYYRPYPEGGYVVVQPPAIVQPPVVQQQVIQTVPAPVMQQQAQTPGTITINIPNAKGGYTSVTLKKLGNGYTGPQGEYYPDSPTVEQLKVLYGK